MTSLKHFDFEGKSDDDVLWFPDQTLESAKFTFTDFSDYFYVENETEFMLSELWSYDESKFVAKEIEVNWEHKRFQENMRPLDKIMIDV